MGFEDVEWVHLGPLVVISASVSGAEFVDHLNYYQLLKGVKRNRG
jgi:hypothetical protein